MKHIVIVIISIIIFSCSIDTTNIEKSDSEIYDDLSDFAVIIPMINAGLDLTDETNALLNGTRAIDPKAVSEPDTTQMTKYFGNDYLNNPNSPHTVFNNNLSEVSKGVLRIPSSGTLQGLYGNDNNDFYMTMKNISGKQYIVKLYVYPRNIFNIDYNYTEYYVDEDNADGSWAWSYFDNRGVNNSYASQVTYYRDGTYSERSSTIAPDDTLYDSVVNTAPAQNTTVSNLISNQLSNYEFAPETLVTTTTDPDAYSSYTESIIKGSNTMSDTKEYYTEDSTNNYSVLYSSTRRRNDERYSVTRYIQNKSTGETNILALNRAYNNYTEINRIKTTSTTYNGERHIWRNLVPSSSLNVNKALSFYNNLTKDGDYYKGTLEEYIGRIGLEYSYSINTKSGVVELNYLGFGTRSISGKLQIDLTDLGNIELSSSSSDWTFTTSYEANEFIGKYKVGNFEKDVIISLEGITIEDTFYPWEV